MGLQLTHSVAMNQLSTNNMAIELLLTHRRAMGLLLTQGCYGTAANSGLLWDCC